MVPTRVARCGNSDPTPSPIAGRPADPPFLHSSRGCGRAAAQRSLTLWVNHKERPSACQPVGRRSCHAHRAALPPVQAERIPALGGRSSPARADPGEVRCLPPVPLLFRWSATCPRGCATARRCAPTSISPLVVVPSPASCCGRRTARRSTRRSISPSAPPASAISSPSRTYAAAPPQRGCSARASTAPTRTTPATATTPSNG